MRSEHDGRVDPLQQRALRRALSMAGVDQLPTRVKHLERLSGQREGWQLHSQDGKSHKVETVVICTALGSQIAAASHRPMDAVLQISPRTEPRRLGFVACGAHLRWHQPDSAQPNRLLGAWNLEKTLIHQRLS